MNTRRLFRQYTCAAMMLAGAAALPTAASAADWQDFYVGYRYGTRFTEPGIDGDISKSIINVSYANGWKYGENFFNIDILFSSSNDPASPVNPQDNGPGAREFYGIYRGQISLNKTTGVDTKAFGIIRDYSLIFGSDMSSKNTTFAPMVLKWMGGAAINFDVPGFWYVSLMWTGEHNHNGYAGPSGANVDFSPTWRVESAWLIAIPQIRSKFAGYMDWIGPKGNDGFGVSTVTEYHTNAYLMLDVGSFFWKKETIWAGIGYEYWLNKFGTPSWAAPGTKTSAPMIAFEFHL